MQLGVQLSNKNCLTLINDKLVKGKDDISKNIVH